MTIEEFQDWISFFEIQVDMEKEAASKHKANQGGYHVRK